MAGRPNASVPSGLLVPLAQSGQFSFPDVPSGDVAFELWDAAGPLGQRANVLVESGIDALLEFD